jgi:tight adherence protein C
MPLELMKMLGVIGTFAGLAGGLYYVLRLRTERAAIRTGLERALYSGEAVLAKRRMGVRAIPFQQRVLRPTVANVAGLVYRFGPKGVEESNRRRLQLAGLADKLDPDTFFAISIASPFIALGFIGLWSQVIGPIPGMLWLFVPGSSFGLKMWLTRRVEARQQRIQLALPDTLDLLTIAVEAGLGFDAALSRVVGAIQGPLSDEMYRMLQELKIGIPRHQALKNLSVRTEVDSLDQFITAVNQADAFGISIGRVLRVQATQLRSKRQQLAQEKAAKTPVKILFPLMVCIFPALFTVLVGPAALSVMGNLSGL